MISPVRRSAVGASRKTKAAGPCLLLPSLVIICSVTLAAPTLIAADEVPVAAAKTILILPFDMVDSSLQGEMNNGPLKADVARLQRTEKIVRRAIAGQPEFRVVSTDDIRAAIKQAQDSYRYLYQCNGCEIDLGKAAGADLVMTGWVQKVSNLILNVNATIRRVATGNEVAGASVDMRSNTDKSWRRAALYMVENSLMSRYHARRENAKKAITKHASDRAGG